MSSSNEAIEQREESLASYQADIIVARELILSDYQFACKYFYKLLRGKNKIFMWNWHHTEVIELLMALYTGKVQNALINIPPGYSKSLLAIVFFIAWCLARDPSNNFLHSSYGNTVIGRNSYFIKTIMNSDDIVNIYNDKGKSIPLFGYRILFPETEIDPRRNSLLEWSTTAMGSFFAASWEGGITGLHAGELLEKKEDEAYKFTGAFLLDDPHKPQEMVHKSYRKKCVDTYIDTQTTRFAAEDIAKLLIMQRLHEEDLSGYIIANELDQWEHLCIPALMELKKIWVMDHKMYPDEKKQAEVKPEIADEFASIWPAKNSTEFLNNKKNSTDIRVRTMFSGQYQQRPAPEEGITFNRYAVKRWQTMPPNYDLSMIVCDTAQNTQESNDCYCFGYLQRYMNELYLIDMINDRFSLDVAKEELIKFQKKWMAEQMHIEQQANGFALRDVVVAEEFMPVFLFDAKKFGDKQTRAETGAIYWNSGRFHVPDFEVWTADVIEQCVNFPNAAHDDMVDMVSSSCILAGLIEKLHSVYNPITHLRDRLAQFPSHLVIIWNCHQQLSCLIADVTMFNQVRILDFDINTNHLPVEDYINSVIQKHRQIMTMTKRMSTTLLTNNPKVGKFEKDDKGIYNFPDILQNAYKMYPQIEKKELNKHRLFNVVELSNQLILKNVYDPVRKCAEPMILISKNAIHVDRALAGGLALDSKKSIYTDANTWELNKLSPYFEIGQCFYNLIHLVWMKIQAQNYQQQQNQGDLITGQRSGTLDIGAIY